MAESGGSATAFGLNPNDLRFVRRHLALLVSLAGFVLATGLYLAGVFGRGAPVAGGVAVLVVSTVAAARWVGRWFRRYLWRISRKLVVSYVFIAIAPVIVLGLVFACVTYLAAGQLIAYMAWRQIGELTHEVDTAVAALTHRIAEVTNGTADFGAARSAIDRAQLDRELQSLRGRFPNVVGRTVLRSKSGDVHVPPGFEWPYGEPARAPEWIGDPQQVPAQLVVGRDNGLEVRGAARRLLDDGEIYVELSAPLDQESLEILQRFLGMDLRVLQPIAAGPGLRVVSESQSLDWNPDSGESRPYRVFGILFVKPLRWSDGLPVAEGRLVVTQRGISALLGELYDFRAENRVLILSVLALVLFALVLFEACSLAIGLWLARSITVSVDELFLGTQRIERGDFSHPIRIRTVDQLGSLGRAFNSMAIAVQKLVRESAERERLEEEMRIGRKIQQSLLPAETFAHANFEMAAFSLPSREVGGDYFDYFPIGENRLGILVADVSGKGTEAAFYMAELKGLMLALTRRHVSPLEVLCEANLLLSESLDRRTFVTMTYAVLDLDNGNLEIGRAGHNPTLVLRHGAGSVTTHQPGGLALGIDRKGGFRDHLEIHSLRIGPGDSVLFYTDGVTETIAESGEFYGQDRLEETWIRHRDRDARGLRDAMVADLRNFAAAGPTHDDVTIIVLRALGCLSSLA